MKDIKAVVCCIVDYGKFTFVAECMAQKCSRVFYHTPMDKEFIDPNDCVKGEGLPNIERLDDIFDPDFFPEIDLFIFPDIGFGPTQRYLRSVGKIVWGAMGGGDLELYRTEFLDVVKKMGLETVSSVRLRGLTNLTSYLRNQEDVWVKINRYRAVMETRKHIDFAHSREWLSALAVRLGGIREQVTFLVQNKIDADIEIGYDGWCVDGKYPSASMQGYEAKNELYLGTVLPINKTPKLVLDVNEAMAPVLKKYGYRNFIATEIRKKEDKFYYIDPTHRMPGLTGDQLPESCSNLPEVIWAGANGVLIEPKFTCKFAAVATLHYKNHVAHEWFTLHIPDKVRKWFKLYHFCKVNDYYEFIPSVPFECDEAGTVIGLGDTVEQAIEHLKKNLKEIEDEPVTTDLSGFADLIEQIKTAQKQGVHFTSRPLPPKTIAL